MSPLARPNLFPNAVRCAVTLTGTLLAVVLVLVPLRLSLGSKSNVDHSGVDSSIVSRSNPAEGRIEKSETVGEKSTSTWLKEPGAHAECPYIGTILVTILGHLPK